MAGVGCKTTSAEREKNTEILLLLRASLKKKQKKKKPVSRKNECLLYLEK